MALNINGTTGISGVDGSNASPAIQGTDSNTGVSFGTDTVNINTGGTTRATVNSAGRFLVGTTTAGDGGLHQFTIGDSSHTGITLRGGTSSNANIYFADGTSGTDEYRGYVQYQHGSDALAFGTGAAERMRIDSSGNVGIGASNPQSMLHLKGNSGVLSVDSYPTLTLETGSADATADKGTGILFLNYSGSGGAFGGSIQCLKENATNNNTANYMRFSTRSAGGSVTERIRIDSGGNVGIGTSSPNNADSGDGGLQINPNISNGAPQVAFKRANNGNISNAIVFVNGNVGVGSISYTNGGTSYNTSSDYRLKENVTAISDGITRLKTLKPSRFNFKVDTDTTVDGFLAHEVSSIVPEAISGTKDEVVTQAMIDAGDYKEGTLNDPIHQGIDQSKIVPLLTAALQEAIAKIETLETKVAALEAG